MKKSRYEEFMKVQQKHSKQYKISQFESKKKLCYKVAILIFVFSITFYIHKYSFKKFTNHESSETTIDFSEQKISSLNSVELQKQRDDRVTKRLEFLRNKKKSHFSLSPPEEFDIRFLEFTKTKSFVSGDLSKDHCLFKGVKKPKIWTDNDSKILQHNLKIPEHHLTKFHGEILSLDHELCTTKHPFHPISNQLNLIHNSANDKTEVKSALIFEDVCITFNLDSLKKSQRGIIIFDNTNENKERCVPCPNPQMSKIWGSTECGIMWLHQINAMSTLRDYKNCYQENNKKIKMHGQRQRPGEIENEKYNEILGGIYYKKSTLILQYVEINPGHQLWDFLLSLVPVLKNNIHFDFTISHSNNLCSDNIWICRILRKLGVFKKQKNDKFEHIRGGLRNDADEDEENVIQLFPRTITCFEKIIAPISGWDHANDMLDENEVTWLRDRVQEAFFPPSLKIEENDHPQVLLYPHNTIGEAGKRRAWLDVDETLEEAENQGLEFELIKIDDFAKLSIDEQAMLFHTSDALIMSHGGQMGNAIFCKENTIIVEVTCSGYSQLGSNNGMFTMFLKLKHVIYKPCFCEKKGSDSSNYKLPLNEVLALFKDKNQLNHGTLRKNCVFKPRLS